ncbi:proteasome 26S subunit [Cryptosporidium ryanae]|uniref:proteasome 26S subunit n=1 Tax=Cryptosporidium ryanae TaxID=515981 RepID=UPI00351A18E6|nr:proteasome 26S subunit [Cryptosporidium ryanae]
MEELIKRKTEIEDEVNRLMDFLNSCGINVGLKGKLVDNEGFPRPDIDIFEVRKARNRIAILNTDYTNLMNEIENKLIEIHKNEKIKVNIEGRARTSEKNNLKYPFGYVDSLLPDSPADLSGIKEGDIIVDFGDIYTEKELETKEESKLLVTKTSELALANVDKLIQVTLLRNTQQNWFDTLYNNSPDLSYSSINMSEFETISVQLTPRRWEGPGVLGCHIAYFHRKPS